MKVSLKPQQETFDAIHPDTGIAFTLRPISPRKYQELQGKSRDKKGEINPVTFAANVAEYAISGWGTEEDEHRVDADCGCIESRRTFGEQFAFTIMPWITNQAMDIDRHIQEEVGEAKKG